MIVTVCLMTMMIVNPQPAFARLLQEAEKQEQKAEKRANQQSRRATETRDGVSRRAEMAADSARGAQRAARDSMRSERGNRPDGERNEERPEREAREGRQVDPAEREARQAEQGPRENDRGLRGRDLSPEELQVQLAEAKAQEMSRHENRMAQIAEIRTHAEQNANSNALERITMLVEKENVLHEKKMGKITQLEEKLARRTSGEKGPRGENEGRTGEAGRDGQDRRGGNGAESKAGESDQGN